MKKRLFAIILFLGFLFLSFYLGFNTQNYSYQKNIYFFNTSKVEFKNIGLIDTYKKSSIINNKIAPGTNGAFYIMIKDDIDYRINYRFAYKEQYTKPDGLYFMLNGKRFETLQDLISQLNINLNDYMSETIKVEWYWDFNGNDIKDTIDGIQLKNYCFEIALITDKENVYD